MVSVSVLKKTRGGRENLRAAGASSGLASAAGAGAAAGVGSAVGEVSAWRPNHLSVKSTERHTSCLRSRSGGRGSCRLGGRGLGGRGGRCRVGLGSLSGSSLGLLPVLLLEGSLELRLQIVKSVKSWRWNVRIRVEKEKDIVLGNRSLTEGG